MRQTKPPKNLFIMEQNAVHWIQSKNHVHFRNVSFQWNRLLLVTICFSSFLFMGQWLSLALPIPNAFTMRYFSILCSVSRFIHNFLIIWPIQKNGLASRYYHFHLWTITFSLPAEYSRTQFCLDTFFFVVPVIFEMIRLFSIQCFLWFLWFVKLPECMTCTVHNL